MVADPCIRGENFDYTPPSSCDKPEAVFGNDIPAWKPTEATSFDPVLPVSTIKQPHTACGLAEALNLDTLKSKLENGAVISEATDRDIDWHGGMANADLVINISICDRHIR